MKSLFVTLLILSGLFLAYDYYLAAPWERLVFERGAKPPRAKTQTGVPQHEIEDSGPGLASSIASSAATASDYVVKVPEIPAKTFVPPVVASLEEITQNWLSIPAHAFPREVKVRKAVDVKMTGGAARIQAGGVAYAKSAEKGVLTVTPTPTSSAWGTVPVADTDLPDQLRQSYEKWKSYRIEQARKVWLGKKTAKPMASVTVNDPVDLTGAVGASGKPMQRGDGAYPLLLASMKAGEVTDITLPRVRQWGTAEPKMVNGQPSWAVDVWYETMVFSGPMLVQAQAVVRDGKVISWKFPSGEQVP